MAVFAGFIVPHPPLIIPQIGNGQEASIQSTIDAYHQIAREIAELKPDTIVLTSPHSELYSDYFHISPGKGAKGDFTKFGCKQVTVSVDYDEEFVVALEEMAWKETVPAGVVGERRKELDHGTMIPLYFINQYYTDYKLVRIGISGEPATKHYQLGMCVQSVANEQDKRVVFIASGDLSHKLKEEGPYGYKKEGPVFDEQVTKAMARGDFLSFLQFKQPFREAAAECGLGSFQIMAGAFDQIEFLSKLLTYEGPFGVGYAVASFYPKYSYHEKYVKDVPLVRPSVLTIYMEQEAERLAELKRYEDAYVKLARKSVEHHVELRGVLTEQEIKGMQLPPEMFEKTAGVFVSIKKNGHLRGCIGTIAPTQASIAMEIVCNAVSACAHDTRFDPVTESELQELEYSVDVLSPPETINSLGQLDVKKYGVIVTKGFRRGLLLPNLEGVTTVEEQVGIAKDKAGIKRDSIVELQRFEVVRHK
ncbi:MAG TPA: AmmeMemoRadiSam system protein A [Lachnospiraceae bacterium]|nr:AmmeMemoRadiSam system protein A [Lachnospiraceae bacterium]